MSVYAVMTTKNEGDRYLRPVLNRLLTQVDGVFVFDDRSSDNAQGLARGLGAEVVIRHVDTPSFMEDESAFRTASYEAFAKHVKPKTGDWVLSIDADEMLVEDDVDIRSLTTFSSNNTYQLRKAEVFDVHPINDIPYIRVDGFWGDIWTPRLFRWFEGMDVAVPDGIMGCGSVPAWAFRSQFRTNHVSLLHYGYADEKDRVTKYARYFGLPGHNVKHIDSILRKPMLKRWDGPHL